MPKARETRSGGVHAAGQTGTGEGKRYMATPDTRFPVGASLDHGADLARHNVIFSTVSGQWIVERRAATWGLP